MFQLILLITILVGGYGALTLWSRLRPQQALTPLWRGRISAAMLFVFTGAGHFYLTEGMVQMLPPFVPWRVEIIYITGVLEILGAIGLLIPGVARWAALALIIFLFGVLPSNVYAAMNEVDFGAHAWGPIYLLARVPFQLFVAGWLYHFGWRAMPAGNEASVPAPRRIATLRPHV